MKFVSFGFSIDDTFFSRLSSQWMIFWAFSKGRILFDQDYENYNGVIFVAAFCF
jgi:hypothetical protein